MAIKPAVWVLGGLATLATAVGVWAQIPDSMLNKQIDQWRADRTHGRLVAVSDNQPLGNRYPIVAILGLNGSTDEDGPVESELMHMVGGILPDTATVYQEFRPEHEFAKETKVYGYWYNSNAGPETIATWLNALIENHPELSHRRFSVWCHSMGGKVTYCYWVQSRNRRLDAKVTAGTPFNGALLSDPVKTNEAIDAGFPKLIAIAAKKKATERKVDFSAPGLQWLRLGYQPMIQLLSQHPLDNSWTIMAGTTTPSRGVGKYIDLAIWLDRAMFAQSQDQDFKAYQVGAYVLEQGGILGGSDGVVGVDSALCTKFAGSATTVTLPAHNHSQMWWGNGGLELRREMLRPVIPYIVANQLPASSPFINGFDIWLPSTPVLDLPKNQIADLKTAELVWVSDGELVVAKSAGASAIKLTLGRGFTWPSWSGDDIVATWEHDGRSDVIVAKADTGEVIQLTEDGNSRLAVACDDDSMIAYKAHDLMVMDSSTGLARVLVQGPLVLTSPPVFVGNRLYFAVNNNGVDEVRWVNPKLNDRRLDQTARVGAVVTRPLKFGSAALAFNSQGELVLISPWWTGRSPLSNQVQSVIYELSGMGMPTIDLVDFASSTGDVYWVCGGNQICQLDLGLVAQSFGPNTPTVSGWEAVAKPLALGVQLDVK